MLTPRHIPDYLALIRITKPIGILLLLWPTLWALWLASGGLPPIDILLIFVSGVIVMRSAGCIINDIADRHVDGHVARTKNRPLASGRIKTAEALSLFLVLLLCAFGLVLLCNRLTIELAFVGAVLATVYPFLKRVTSLPQLGLGMAFAWGVPMAFAAVQNQVPSLAWWLFLPALIWPVIYDTMYAMADRHDDIKVGIKSTAILFGGAAPVVLALLQVLFLLLMLWVGVVFKLTFIYYISLLLAFILFIYHLYLIKDGDPAHCFKAFLHNNWVGVIIFIGILLSQA